MHRVLIDYATYSDYERDLERMTGNPVLLAVDTLHHCIIMAQVRVERKMSEHQAYQGSRASLYICSIGNTTHFRPVA